jgi:hypothetical protein
VCAPAAVGLFLLFPSNTTVAQTTNLEDYVLYDENTNQSHIIYFGISEVGAEPEIAAEFDYVVIHYIRPTSRLT